MAREIDPVVKKTNCGLTTGCTAVTIASLAVCLPVVWLFVRYLPQLVGWPRVQGPLLPRLIP